MDFAGLVATANLLVGVLATLLALVILRENPSARLNRLTALLLFFAGVGAVLGSGSLVDSPLAGQPGRSPAALVVTFSFVWELFFPTLLLFALSFPEESPWIRRRFLAEGIVYLPHTIHFFLMFFALILGPGFSLPADSGEIPAMRTFLRLLEIGLRRFLEGHHYLFSLVNLAYVGLAVSLIARSLARARNLGLRSQLQVILYGIAIGVGAYSVAAPLNVLLRLSLPHAFSSALLVAALTCWSGTIAFAIVRYRFLDARWIVRRTILYALASAVVVGIYLRIIRRLGEATAGVLQVPPGVLDWVAVVVPLVLFQPMIARMEEVLEGWLLRGRRELRSLAAQLSRQMSVALEFEPLARSLVTELPDALTASGAAVLVRSRSANGEERFRVAASRGLPDAGVAYLATLAPGLPAAGEAGRPHQSRDWLAATAASRGAPSAGAADRIRESGVELAFDLQHAADRLGLLLIGRKVSSMRYGREEVTLLGSLASQAGIALLNHHLYRETIGKAILDEELALARRIQQAFLPSRFPDGGPIDVHGLNLPSKQVGGDYFDFLPLADGGYAFAIADVAGKGVPAALTASMIHASLRTLVREGSPIGRVMERLNLMLCESTTPEQFVTLFLGRIDATRREIVYCNAGHNYPIRVGGGGVAEAILPSQLVLGVDDRFPYEESRTRIGPSDTVLLFTDGVTEARSPLGEEFGESRLTEIARSGAGRRSRELVGSIRDEVLRFTGSEEIQDDMTLLCMRWL